MHISNHPRPWRAKQPAGLSGHHEVLVRVASAGPAAASESALEAGA